MVREIVTIQLGSLSNYIATHFWNAQEAYFTYGDEVESSVDHDIHWRQGIGIDGTETFLPRTVVYDFKASFGSLGKTNPLYGSQENGSPEHLWHPGSPTVHRLPAIKKNPYQQSLDIGTQPPVLTPASVQYWSDFSRVFLHPKSLVPLSELQLAPTQALFDDWFQGRDLFQALDNDQDLLDNHLRPFVEECDLLQGLQMMATIDDGWGGFASLFLERIKDEFPKHCVWLWAPENTPSRPNRGKQDLRLRNKARCLAEVWQQASAVIPLCLPELPLPGGVVLDPTSPWHTSALFSAGMETATLPSRLRRLPGTPISTLGDIADSLNIGGKRTISRLGMRIGTGGTPIPSSESYPKSLLHIDLSSLVDPSTSTDKPEEKVYSQILTQRGDDRLQEDVDAVYESILGRVEDGGFSRRTTRYCSKLGYPILDSYPVIYRATSSDDNTSISVDTLLHSDSSVGTAAKILRTRLLPILQADDRETLGNSLAEIQDEYRDGWSSGSDDDDDDDGDDGDDGDAF